MTHRKANNITRHVVPHKEGWANRRGGAQRATSLHTTKSEAERVARKQSQREGGELFIHGRNGAIQRKDSHGNDPRHIRG